MIAVIADDFTGAAEIGGIALRHGLKVVIETELCQSYDTDLVVVATNTRSLPGDKAGKEIEQVTARLMELKPQYIFKKLDSVLRGNILKELHAQLSVMKRNRALVVAGNPAFGRLIKNGLYYVNGVPLNMTFFANDPDFPIKSHSIKEIVESDGLKIISASVDSILPEEGLLFCDITSPNDMTNWVGRLDDSMLPAGGAGFFDAILDASHPKVELKKAEYNLGERVLFVFGSTFPKRDEIIEKLISSGLYFSYMPRELYVSNCDSCSTLNEWAEDVAQRINEGQRVVAAVNYSDKQEDNLSLRIQSNMAMLVQRVMELAEVEDLLIEGGATTSEILKLLGIKNLYPYQELEAGVIQMRTDVYEKLLITTKPGSYQWPESIVF